MIRDEAAASVPSRMGPGIQTRRAFATAALAIAALVGPSAHAGPNDFVLHRFLAPSDGDGSSQTCLNGQKIS